jgi:cellulose synthase/poly-beta-1,6-N-acetylglucosamine synthase-like glycosyltransferase
MTELPGITVVVPAYQAETAIDDCIESLINLHYPKDKIEIIVVDNNSTDSTGERIKNYDVKYLFEEHRNAYSARNKGIENAKFELVAFTDSDCIVSAEWLRNILKYFESENVGIVGGKILPFSIENEIERFIDFRKILDQEKMLEKSEFSYPFCVTANCIVKRSILEELGGFDTYYKIAGDADLCWRAYFKGIKTDFAKDAVVYHKHRNNVRNLYNQSFQYGFGRASLFKKHHSRFGKRVRFDWEEYIFLYESIRDYLLSLFCLKNPSVKNQFLYDIISMSGLIAGKLYGSIKRKTLVF